MKRIKMVIYGEPGVGKSVFASKAPKPFFITTDGNYEWLEDFGADPNAHIQVKSWDEAKKAFAMDFKDYETIVIDLTEDLFKWCEYEYCLRNGLNHLSDQGFGKAYDITRNEFFIELCQLIALDKNIIFIMHGITFTVKDRRGVESTKYGPTTRIPDKVIDMIEGRVRYFLRCYLKAEEQPDGTIAKKRYLSLIPKENEFGICRGIDESKVPQDIPLDFDEFAKWIGLYNVVKHDAPMVKQSAKTTIVDDVPKKVEKSFDRPAVEELKKVDMTPIEQAIKESTQTDDNPPWEETVIETKPAEKVKETATDEKPVELSAKEKLELLKKRIIGQQNK